MATAYEYALEKVVKEKLEKMRIETQKRLDRELDNMSQVMREEGLPMEDDVEEDIEWTSNNIGRYKELLSYRRKTLKLRTFKSIDMDELNIVLRGLNKLYPSSERS